MYFKRLNDKECLVNVDEMTHISRNDNRIIFWVDEMMIEVENYDSIEDAKMAFILYEHDLCQWSEPEEI